MVTFDYLKKRKLAEKPNELFQASKTKILAPILEEAYNYKYEEKPNYGKLRFMLEIILLNNDLKPDLKFSWVR